MSESSGFQTDRYIVAWINGKVCVLRRVDDIPERYQKRGLKCGYDLVTESTQPYNAIDVCMAMNTSEAMGEFEDRSTSEICDKIDESIARLDAIQVTPEGTP